ncbi:hypothetical protein MESS4_670023 [Mesorhizobium sp. STM 4661]|nr:hypothetical protein MESS4_670023 [Mesorhizobium sp. STM 4661]
MLGNKALLHATYIPQLAHGNMIQRNQSNTGEAAFKTGPYHSPWLSKVVPPDAFLQVAFCPLFPRAITHSST